jgi:tetratricopeptide (TPR) repeat protein
MRLVVVLLYLLVYSVSAFCIEPARQGVNAQASPQVQTPATANDIDQLKAQLQALQQELTFHQAVSDNRMQAQDQRIGDLNISTSRQANYMAAISNVTTWVGIAIAVIAFGAGFIVYFSATSRASAEAKKVSERWFQVHSSNLRGQIEALKELAGNLQSQVDSLRQKAEGARAEIDDLTIGVDAHAKQKRRQIDKAAQQILEMSAKTPETRESLDPAAIEIVQQASEALQAKPENAFTAEDHYSRGLSEFTAGRFDSALVSFDKAVALSRSHADEDYARYLYARAVALYQLGRHSEAISVYDDMDKLYGHDEFPSIRKQVARALVNKGIILGLLNRSEEAISIYDEIIKRYEGDERPRMRETVAIALNGRALRSVMLSKCEWQAETKRAYLLTIAIGDLRHGLQQCVIGDREMLLGNLGYALFLPGNLEKAELQTRECLRLGQAKSLEEQRGDAKLHRVEPQDSEYERLLDKLWAEIQATTPADTNTVLG